MPELWTPDRVAVLLDTGAVLLDGDIVHTRAEWGYREMGADYIQRRSGLYVPSRGWISDYIDRYMDVPYGSDGAPYLDPTSPDDPVMYSWTNLDTMADVARLRENFTWFYGDYEIVDPHPGGVLRSGDLVAEVFGDEYQPGVNAETFRHEVTAAYHEQVLTIRDLLGIGPPTQSNEKLDDTTKCWRCWAQSVPADDDLGLCEPCSIELKGGDDAATGTGAGADDGFADERGADSPADRTADSERTRNRGRAW